MAKRKRPDYVAPQVKSKPASRASRDQHRSEAAERRAREAEAKQRAALIRRTVMAGAGLAVAAVAITTYLVVDRSRDSGLERALTAGTCRVDERTDPNRGGLGQNHVANPTYSVNPPAGGAHTEQVARAGVYRGTAVPPDGHLVHALEHGYVVLWHRPDLPPAERAVLERLAEKHEGDVIVAERTELPDPVAATAWGKRLLCGKTEETPLDRFAQAYIGDGPEKVQRG